MMGETIVYFDVSKIQWRLCLQSKVIIVRGEKAEKVKFPHFRALRQTGNLDMARTSHADRVASNLSRCITRTVLSYTV
jgi:hypothetical protein